MEEKTATKTITPVEKMMLKDIRIHHAMQALKAIEDRRIPQKLKSKKKRRKAAYIAKKSRKQNR